MSLLMNNAASMNLLSANRRFPRLLSTPREAECRDEKPYLPSDFIFTLNLFTRAHALDLCGHAKRKEEASRRSDPRRKNSFLVNERSK